jgi:NADPH:quinone reductase-like Zn-dependent oxidoreductase
MKAIRIQDYGGPENMHLEEVPRPELRPDQVLVRIHDAGVNPVDWKIREGQLRKMHPVEMPLTLGQDFAGEVVEAGERVSGFRAGDAVFGFADGSYAELAAASAGKIARIPDSLDYATAASLPTAGLTAFQILTNLVRPSAADTVLIHGAAGGVGSFAVQIAKERGATVIAHASGADADYLRSIGADEVIDHRTQRFEDVVREVHAVIDLVGGDVCRRSYPLVKPDGILVSTVGAADEAKGKERGILAVNFVMQPEGNGLAALARLVERGAVKPRLDRVLPLAEARRAQDLNQTGHSHGKVVLRVLP